MELGREVERERGRWEEEVKILQERLVTREGDNQWQEERRELEQRLEEVKEQVESERGKREEAEEMVSRLSHELENEEKELLIWMIPDLGTKLPMRNAPKMKVWGKGFLNSLADSTGWLMIPMSVRQERWTRVLHISIGTWTDHRQEG